MIGEIMKNKLSIAALVAGGMMVATAGSAQAADLGGDCCADLEERVATLEATTARKGNRKVSLTISGQVNQALTIWDDGVDSDAYMTTNNQSNTRFRFVGGAQINSEWSAGYVIEIGLPSAVNSAVTQLDDDAGAGTFDLRKSFLYLKSNSLGKLSWGKLSSATDDLAAYSQFVSGGAFQPDSYQGVGLFFRNGAGALTGTSINSIHMGYDDPRIDGVRYDTPTIAGFVLSASWGEDDHYGVALRFAQTLGDFKVKAGAGYSVDDDDNPSNANVFTIESLILNAGIQHVPTGLFVSGHYRENEFDGLTTLKDADGWQIQAGIQQRWNSLGKTTIFGAYQENEDVGAVAGATSELEIISIGLVQNIDAAALELYAVYDHYEGETSANADLQDVDVITLGGRIKF